MDQLAPDRLYIQHGKQEHFDKICELLREMHAEVGLMRLDKLYMMDAVQETIDNNAALVLCKGNEIIGTMGLDGYRPWYSADSVLQDRWLYIAKEHRSLEAFKALIEAAQECAEILKMPLYICLQAVQEHDRKDILFRRYMDQVMKAYRFVPCGGYYEV